MGISFWAVEGLRCARLDLPCFFATFEIWLLFYCPDMHSTLALYTPEFSSTLA